MLKSKTTWTAITGIVAALSGYFTGSLEIGAAVNLAFTSFIGLFVLHKLEKDSKA